MRCAFTLNFQYKHSPHLQLRLALSLDAVGCADDVVLVDDGTAADVGRAQDCLQLQGDLVRVGI